MARRDLIEAFQCEGSADLVIDRGQVVNVITAEVEPGGVAIKGDRILCAGDVGRYIGAATTVIDARGRYITPGLIDAHVHSYHALLNPTEHARVTLRTGTTALPESYYAPGIVGGFEAVEFFVGEVRNTPINLLFNVPVIAYLQNRDKGLPATWSEADASRLWEMLDWPDCVAIEETFYDALLGGSDLIMRLAADALARGKVIVGDGTGLTGVRLQMYAAAGVTIDHEIGSAEEAIERVRLGMGVAMRRASLMDNQTEVQRAITEHGFSTQDFVFCSDLLDLATVMRVGHIDESIRLAVRGGIDPIAALQMATIDSARAFRVDHECGSLAPGRRADVLLVGDLARFDVQTVVAGGQLVVNEGEFVADFVRPDYPDVVRLRFPDEPLAAEDFRVAAEGETTTVRVIGGEGIFTDERHLDLPVRDGTVDADVSRDILKIGMVARDGTAKPGIGFIQGWGLKRGAIASTYCPMTFNPIVLGTNDGDMAAAVNAIVEVGGGIAVVADGELLARMPLPLCGIMSAETADDALDEFDSIVHALRGIGCEREAPVHFMAWLGVGGVVPDLKITEQGLFRVTERKHVPTLVDADEAPPPVTIASASKGRLTLSTDV